MKIGSLLIVTGNSGKAEELKELLAVSSISIDYRDLSLLEMQSLNIKEIGRRKTASALRHREEIAGYDAVLTDDTGLMCRSLSGLPGPLIKWFLQTVGTEGLLDMLKGKDPSAVATCLLTLGMVEEGSIHQFEGNVPGRLVDAKGARGFGWDSIFLPDGCRTTYGEMDSKTKNETSHRAQAAAYLRKWLIS